MNRHVANDKDSRSHHELLSQMGQLGHRERVLIGENDQLRAQLVEMKQQENKKYDDLMVQYRQLKANANIKREYEDDGLDNDGTSTNTNQVTDTTESSDEEVKQEIKEEYEEDRDIIIKQEYLDDGLDNDGITSSNTNYVTVKTESSDFEVKEEIKEENDHDDDCDGCDQCLVKKEMVSDDDEQVDNEGGMIQDGDSDEVDSEGHEVIQPNVDNGQLLCSPSRDIASASNSLECIFEGVPNLWHEQQTNNNTLNEPNCVTRVTQSGDLFSPWTSTGQDSNRTMNNEQATVHTQHNHNKRKQTQLKRTDKRAKVTLEGGEGEGGQDGEDIDNEVRDEAKVKVLYLNCTQSKCNVKLDSLDHLHDHLLTVHQLSPYRCFASNCNSRFDNSMQIPTHIKQHHSQNALFLCPVCHKEFATQHKAYLHWYRDHLNGQFQCNFVSDCTEMTDTRNKMRTHQQTKHRSQSKHLHCPQVGCSASFTFKNDLKRHERTHLNTQPFHCIWPQCSIRTNRLSNLVRHIRVQHFSLPKSVKEQKSKNIVDKRDPNEYVRVVTEVED